MKSLLIIIFLTTFTFNVNAQIISSYGLKLGVGISNQSWDYYQADINLDFYNKIGISPRIFADFFNLSFFQLEGEIGYLQKGFEEKVLIATDSPVDGTGEFITGNNRLNYLSFSTLAKFKYENEIFSPYILVGPQLNLLLNKNIEKGLEVVFDRFKENNVGISIGAGTEIKNILPISILIEYRYERDFIDNYDSPNVDIKNYSHIILLGVKI